MYIDCGRKQYVRTLAQCLLSKSTLTRIYDFFVGSYFHHIGPLTLRQGLLSRVSKVHVRLSPSSIRYHQTLQPGALLLGYTKPSQTMTYIIHTLCEIERTIKGGIYSPQEELRI